MATVTLSEAKEHLHVTNTAQDNVIAIYMDAADDHIKNFLNKTQFQKTAAVKAAALLIIGDLFKNREATGEKDFKINPAAKSLLFPYRVDMGI